MRSVRGTSRVSLVAVLLVGLLSASATGAGLPVAPMGLPVADLLPEIPAIPGLLDQAKAAPTFAAWYAWTEAVPVTELAVAARSNAPEDGARLLPLPDTLPIYPGLDEAAQREAWRAWWLAAMVAAARTPHVPAAAAANAAQQSGGGDARSAGPQVPPALGGPRGLDGLWRLEAHGAPIRAESSDGAGGLYLVTDLGVVHLPAGSDKPDWILRLEGFPGRVETAPGTGGARDLVIGTNPFFGGGGASIQVVDGAAGRVLWRGLSDEEALLYWRLTDVDGDGRLDILGLDFSGNLTAVKLDGTRIYRVPLPLPDLPTFDGLPFMPGFLALALEQTGSIAFGDADGDGALDVFTTGFYWLDTWFFGQTSTTAVSAVSGATGEIIWTTLLEPKPFSFFMFAYPAAAGDLNGDGADDVIVSRYVFTFVGVFMEGIMNTVHSGVDGFVLARDDGSQPCVIVCESSTFEPLAIVDRTGAGERVIVGLERLNPWSPPQALVVRTLPLVAGLPTEVVETHDVELNGWSYPYRGHVAIRTLESTGATTVMLFSGQRGWFSLGETGTVYLLDGDGFRAIRPDTALGHVELDTATGAFHAWTLTDDRFRPVGPDLVATGEGMKLLRSVAPIVFYDRDRDGVPDVLLSRSLGYHWASGRTGETIAVVDRPSGVFSRGATQIDGRPFVLEHVDGDLVLFDILRGEEQWRLAADVFSGSWVDGFVDFTGDGRPEILFYEYPTYEYGGNPGAPPTRTDPRYWVYSPDQTATLWEYKGDAHVYALDVDTARIGHELIVHREDGAENTLALRVVGEQAPRWEHRSSSALTPQNAANGLFLIQRAEPAAFVIVDAVLGTTQLEVPIEKVVWAQLEVLRSGAPHLVYSPREEVAGLSGAMRQSVVIVNAANGNAVANFTLVDPEVRTVTIEFYGYRYSYQTIDYAFMGPLVGDWDGDGWADLTLREGGWPVVRSARTGDVLALAPRQGTFFHAIDLNGDGRAELAMRSRDGGSLRIFAFDPSQVLEVEDPLQRIDARQGDDGGNRTGFFEREAPAPAAVLIITGFLGLAAIARRRRVQ